MAGDEKILRITFEGDDSEPRRLTDQRPPESRQTRDPAGAAQEAADSFRTRSEDREADEAMRRFYDEQRRRADDELSRSRQEFYDRRVFTNPDDPLPQGEYIPPEVESEVVDESPVMSSSRAIVPYSPRMAAAGARTAAGAAEAGIIEGEFTVLSGTAGVPAVAAGGAGGGGTAAPVAAAGTGTAAAGAGLTALAGPVAIAAGAFLAIVVAVTAAAVAVNKFTDMLSDAFDRLTQEFEAYGGVLTAARAQQEAELIQKRIEIANNMSENVAEAIAVQTDIQKILMDIRADIAEILAVVLKPLLYIVKGILTIVEFVTGLFGSDDKGDGFQNEWVDFLADVGQKQSKRQFPWGIGANIPRGGKPFGGGQSGGKGAGRGWP